MRCTSCGDTLDEQTKVIREKHQYTIKGKPEETHYDGLGHKITEWCVCGAAHDAGYGKKDKCCKCFGHEWGEAYEENGSWYQKCQVCGEIIDSGKPEDISDKENIEDTDPVTEPYHFFLQLEDDGLWTVGRNYNVILTWEPTDLVLDDDFTWFFGYNKLRPDDYPGPHVIQLDDKKTDYNHAVYRANTPGLAYVGVTYKSYPPVCISIEVKATAYQDEQLFYKVLSRLSDDQTPMENGTIRAIVWNEIMAMTNNDTDLTSQIIKDVEHAPLLYQKLYLWSLFDYRKTLTNNVKNSNYDNYGMLYLKDSTTDAYFHETGHAIDHALNQRCMSSEEYQSSLYNALYYKVYKIIATEVINASSDTELTTEQKNAIIEYIMGEEQDIKWQFKWYGLAFTTLKSEMDDSFNNEQISVFNSVVDSVHQIIKDNPTEGSTGSQMLSDMISGVTNQSVLGGYLPAVMSVDGHGPLTHITSGDKPDYWYTDDGNPTYMQNAEAWAEYFSSIMTGHNLHNNRELFKEACDIMDTMAIDLLEGYITKHSKK
jgi:hypothetical protein